MNPSVVLGDRPLESAELLALLTQYQMLPQLLKEQLIDRAIQDIVLTADEEGLALKQFYAQQHIEDQAQREAWLKYHRMSAERLSNQAFRRFKLEKFKHQTWDAAIEADFLKLKPQMDRFICSIIRTRNLELAQELYFRLKEGEQTFADLAPRYSEGPEAQTSGMIGPVPASGLHPKLVQVLSNGRPGQLWPPQRLEEWCIILKLEQYLPAHLDATTQQQLLQRRFQEWLEQQLETVQFSIPGDPRP
ncbi:peptidylprolyl isomerase [Altericista sp. CCNU0014]|uniref:peptidylprolyl isomerase n=1 Tax=Altericista sp. CCNU0014 TaxID=3082949 RepID=UPI00384D274F